MKGNRIMKKCQNCGQELPDDAKVCDNCGEPVEVVEEDRSENEAKPDNESDTKSKSSSDGDDQQHKDPVNKPEAQEVSNEDEDLVHEHLEPGLNIEAEKEIEKEQQEDPQNKKAEEDIMDNEK